MNTYVKRNSKVLFKRIENEIAVISPDNERLYILNDVCSFIWDMTDKAKNTDEIARSVILEYGISAAEAKKDIEDLLIDIKKSYPELFTISKKPAS